MKSFICAALVAVAYGQEVESFLQENTFQEAPAATFPVSFAISKLSSLKDYQTYFETSN